MATLTAEKSVNTERLDALLGIKNGDDGVTSELRGEHRLRDR